MFRKISFSVLYFVVFFLGISMLLALPDLINSKGASAAGKSIGATYGIYIVVIPFILSVALCFKGILPGTRKK